MIELGWCASVETGQQLRESGLNYVECTVVGLAIEDPVAHAAKLQQYENVALPAKAFNVFFPGDLKIVGPDVPQDRVDTYVKRAAEALQHIGASIVVLGSGGARHIPDGWERARAEEQFLQLLAQMADQFNGSGVTLVIEPLNRKESNLINSVAEAVSFAEKIQSPHIRVLADFYHMDEEQEPLEELIRHKDWISHLHLADTGRLHPGSGQYPYEKFASLVKEMGYQGMISAECKTTDLSEDLKVSVPFMKSLFQ